MHFIKENVFHFDYNIGDESSRLENKRRILIWLMI